MSKFTFKEKFIERYSQVTDIEKFKEFSLLMPRRAIRVNTLKTTKEKLQKELEPEWKLEQIPWYENGFWIAHAKEERRDIGNLVQHSLGYFYVQEAVSMIPPIVLDPKPDEIVLDMCAAPGSKTTQIAMMMQNKGALIANDYKGKRLASLGINLQRMGVLNTTITLMRGQAMKDMQFDRILVDAPCSGTGTIRKSLKTLEMWNPAMIKRLSQTQKSLIIQAYKMLKPGGTMVYSTCSIDPEEDEEVIDYLVENQDSASIEDIKLNINKGKPITEFNKKVYSDQVKKCLRIWPQDNNTEGFFITRIKKNQD